MANTDGADGLVPVSHPSGTISTAPIKFTSANTAVGRHTALAQQTDGTYDIWSSGRIDAVSAEEVSASDGGTHQAYTDPAIVYSVQTDDGTGTGTVQDALTLNFTLVNNSSVTNGISKAELDEDSAAVTATLPLKSVGLDPVIGNSLGEFNRILVILNNTALKGGTGTLGI